eukprot:744447-Pyramimonas_sp.AAC.1
MPCSQCSAVLHNAAHWGCAMMCHSMPGYAIRRRALQWGATHLRYMTRNCSRSRVFEHTESKPFMRPSFG